MKILSPGIIRPRYFRALAFLAVLALGFVLAATPSSGGENDPPIPGWHSYYGISFSTVPAQPCGTTPVKFRFTACECQYDMLGASRDASGKIRIRVHVNDHVCVRCVPDTSEVDIGTLNPGTFLYQVNFDVSQDSTLPDTSWAAIDYAVFTVAQQCSTPPPPTGVPHLDRVVIGTPPCNDCPPRVCAGDSIDVLLAGTFPDGCTHLQKVELFPSAVASPLPQPPLVRLTYGIAPCVTMLCTPGPKPWAARVRLPGLPSLQGRPNFLPIEAYLHDFCSSDSVGTRIGYNDFAFTVVDSCESPPTSACYNVLWTAGPVAVPAGDGAQTFDGPDSSGVGRCTARWVEGGTTRLLLYAGSTVPIGGVQGSLRLGNPGALRIRELRTVFPGWQLHRSRGDDGGERFIAFAGPGAPPLPDSETGVPIPFLDVEVVHNPLLDIVTPDVVLLHAEHLLVSDANGIAIRGCPEPAIYPGRNTAILCRERSCDANGDGASDVRDLVLMANCISPAPNVRLDCTGAAATDCDGDGSLDVPDLTCCARHILGTPPDSLGTVREAPQIVARFGIPVDAGGGAIDIPLTLDGMEDVATARFDVRFPSDRYVLEGFAFDGHPATWMTVHRERDGMLRIGILDLAALGDETARTTAASDFASGRATLRLRLRTGATAGGELAVAGVDLAAGDGATLVTPNASPSVALAGGDGSPRLTTPRPNPFVGTTRFALTVPVTGSVDVGVFAANGRRVATVLSQSAAAPGVYDLVWDGREDGGRRAPSGVYFVRVRGSAGVELTRKVLFLPGAAR